MYNLNVNVSTAAGTAVNNLLAVENATATPRTPEILNSLIAMTNPMDGYNFNNGNKSNKSSCPQNVSNDSNSSSCSQEETSTSSPPSVQHTCSQLIKAGLKLSIESKRKISETHDDFLDLDIHPKRIRKSECDDDGDGSRSPNQGLTPEDEERRRRRRERNKIAATKCRLKKREKTVNLVHESEILETQNIDLKTQIQELEHQRRRLVDMLHMHGPACVKQTNNRDHYNTNSQYIVEDSSYSADGSLPPVTSLATSVIETNQSYRPSSVDTPYRSPNIDCFARSSSVGITNDNSYNRPNNNLQYVKAPSIIVEGDNYSPPHLTNLDNSNQINSFNHYNSNQCHNNYNSPNTNQNYGSPNIDNGCMA